MTLNLTRAKTWYRKPESQISGMTSLTFFGIAFFGFFAILPTFRTIARLNKEIKDSRLVLEQMQTKITNLQTAQINYSQAVNDLPLINQLLPEREQLDELAWQLHYLAAGGGVTITNLSFGAYALVGPTSSQTTDWPVELTASGTYPALKDWLESLNQFNRLITLKDVNFSNKAGKLTATIKLTAAYLSGKGQ
jgi:Tfp pilus assembly protein PilO